MNAFGVIFVILAILRHYGLIELHLGWLFLWLALDLLAAFPEALVRSKK